MSQNETWKQGVLAKIDAFGDRNDDNAFKEIVSGFLENDASSERLRALSKALGASPNSVRRWADGQSAPHPIVRPRVMQGIRKILKTS